MRKNRLLFVSLMLSAVLLAGCSNKDFFITKHWQGWIIKLETRPHPIVAGHDEFLLHVDNPDRHLPEGMIVRYSLDPKKDGWIQAMPDGLSDIFRRALTVNDPKHATLYVRLEYKGKKGLLLFDLSEQQKHD